MPPTAFAAIDFSEADFWPGEVIDIPFNWTPRMVYSANTSAVYGHSATGLSGSGWSAVGQTASAFDFFVAPGFSALASGTANYWSAYSALSGSGSANASSLTGVQSIVRLSATGGTGAYAISARLRTTSGQELRHVITARIVG